MIISSLAVARKKPAGIEKVLAPESDIAYNLQWMSRCRHIISASFVLFLLPFLSVDAESGTYVDKGIVSGRVLDVGSSEGIAGIAVKAFRLGEAGYDVYSAETSTAFDGTYELVLPDGDYVIRIEFVGIGGSVIYYRDEFDPLRARPVTVIPGRTVFDIDFYLNSSVPREHYIAGYVTDESSGEGLPNVIVTARDYLSGRAVNSSLSGYDGAFRVGNLPAGDYMLFFSGYHIIPFFYRATEFWQNAEVIHLETSYDDVQSDAITQDYGNLVLSITGHVESGLGAVGAARVYAYLVGDDRPLAFAVSDDSGEYAIINGLTPGYYRVVCDLFGYDSQVYQGTIYLDLLENPVAEGIDFMLVPHTTGIDDRPEKPEMIDVFQNYPNPFNARTIIPLYSAYRETRAVEVSVYDVLGRRVGRKELSVNPGMNYVNWGLGDFRKEITSGVFFYRIGDSKDSFRMTILK
jgi:hypothetical protein